MTQGTAVLTAPLALLPLQDQHQAVAGLIWRPLPTHATWRTKKQLLQQYQGEQLIVHHQAGQRQCGIAPKLPPGQHYYSAALLLKLQLGDDWVAIFETTNEQYLLFGVKDGQVVPGCDGLFPSAAAVLAHFERYQLLCQWNRCYAPAQFNLAGDVLPLSSLLNQQTPLLYPLTTPSFLKNQLLPYAATAMLLVSGIAYWGMCYQQRQRQQLHLAQQQQRRLVQQKRQQPQQQTTANFWQQQPPARWLLHICVQQISRYPLILGGWQLQQAHCNAQGSQAIYQKTVLAQKQAFVEAARRFDACCQPSINDQQAQLQQPLPSKPLDRHKEQLQPLHSIYQSFQQLLEQYEIEGKLVHDSKQQKSAAFTFISPNSPLKWLLPINFEGVVFQQIDSHFSPQGGLLWSLQGALYGT